MRKRYRNPPPAPPEAVLLDRYVVAMLPGREWIGGPALALFRALLCRRGKLHLCRAQLDGRAARTVCGEWVGVGSLAPGWSLAPGTWCSTGVVRCQHCEKSLARTLGEPAARRT